MNELRWAGGELCRVGDVVQWKATVRYECTGLGELRVLLKDTEGEEFARLPHDYVLLHRAGETEDRDRAIYEYHEGEPPAFYERWEALAGGNTLQFRRLRQPPAAPAFDPSFAPKGYVAQLSARDNGCRGCALHSGTAKCNRTEPEFSCIGEKRPDGQDVIFVLTDPPAPPKRRMKANDKVEDGDAVRNSHSQEHDEDGECNLKPACEPVDPPAPKPRRMMANDLAGPPHDVEHDERDSCQHAPFCRPIGNAPACEPLDPPPKPRRMKANPCLISGPHSDEHDGEPDCCARPACEPVDPQPTFEARIYPVLIDDDGNCYLQDACVSAHVGYGDGQGYTQAAFCETKDLAEELAQSYRDHGILIFSFRAHDSPLCRGKLLPFAVAVKVTK